MKSGILWVFFFLICKKLYRVWLVAAKHFSGLHDWFNQWTKEKYFGTHWSAWSTGGSVCHSEQWLLMPTCLKYIFSSLIRSGEPKGAFICLYPEITFVSPSVRICLAVRRWWRREENCFYRRSRCPGPRLQSSVTPSSKTVLWVFVLQTHYINILLSSRYLISQTTFRGRLGRMWPQCTTTTTGDNSVWIPWGSLSYITRLPYQIVQFYELLHSEHLNKLCQTAVVNFLIICAFLYILALNSKHSVVSFLVRSVAASGTSLSASVSQVLSLSESGKWVLKKKHLLVTVYCICKMFQVYHQWNGCFHKLSHWIIITTLQK